MSAEDYSLGEPAYIAVIRKFLDHNIYKHRLPLPIAMKRFKTITNGHDRVDFTYDFFSYLNPPGDLLCSPKKEKNDEEAVKLREEGNRMFCLKNLVEALKLYTQSIGYAENNSFHLGLAYGNRSAVLFEKSFYQECLEDIGRAFQSNYPVHLNGKLLRRQKLAEDLQKNHPKFCYHEKVPEIKNKHPRIAAAADCVDLRRNEAYGTHVVTTRNVQAGEIISVEKPFVCNACPDDKYFHCHHCLELCLAMIPCENCATAFYCSPACRMAAFQAYHLYECDFGCIVGRDVTCLNTTLLGAVEHKNFDKVKNDHTYRSDRYKEVYNLERNESKLDLQYHFEMAILAGSIFHLLKERTRFLQENDLNENSVKDVILRNILIENINTLGVLETHFSPPPSCDPHVRTIGQGIYSFTSRFNHSCAANCTCNFYGTICVTTAYKDIKKGEQCTVSYGYHYIRHSRSHRQMVLRKRFMFDCKCIACENFFPLGSLEISPDEWVLSIIRQRPELIVPIMELVKEVGGNILYSRKEAPDAARNSLLKICYDLNRCFREPSESFTMTEVIISLLLSLPGNTKPY